MGILLVAEGEAIGGNCKSGGLSFFAHLRARAPRNGALLAGRLRTRLRPVFQQADRQPHYGHQESGIVSASWRTGTTLSRARTAAC